MPIAQTLVAYSSVLFLFNVVDSEVYRITANACYLFPIRLEQGAFTEANMPFRLQRYKKMLYANSKSILLLKIFRVWG